MGFYVGLDSGGTKTECWLGTETEVLARAVCATVKLTRVGQEVATERLQGLLREVSSLSGVGMGRVSRTCVGVAGYSIGSVREWAARVVGGLVAGDVLVCGDEEIALDAAFRGGAGVLVIGGTGSVVVGRCGDGTRFTAGGWGPAIGDEGSGYWIGAEAVRAAFWALDRGVPTGLMEGIRVSWGVEGIGEMVGYANARPGPGVSGPDWAALAPVVMGLAEAGDAVATGVLERAGVALADQVVAVWARMQAAGEIEVEVAYTGSVLERIGRVRERMARELERVGLRVRDGAVNSMEGAMWRARGGS